MAAAAEAAPSRKVIVVAEVDCGVLSADEVAGSYAESMFAKERRGTELEVECCCCCCCKWDGVSVCVCACGNDIDGMAPADWVEPPSLEFSLESDINVACCAKCSAAADVCVLAAPNTGDMCGDMWSGSSGWCSETGVSVGDERTLEEADDAGCACDAAAMAATEAGGGGTTTGKSYTILWLPVKGAAGVALRWPSVVYC